MDATLRSDPRVRLLEKANARYLTAEQLWAKHLPQPIRLVAMDVSFISATLVLPAVVSCARLSSAGFEAIVLVKPQFEVGRGMVGKGGIVRDPALQQSAVQRVSSAVEELGGLEINVIESPILGTEGNREFLLHARFGSAAAEEETVALH
jgi:23S rRNA (cytidine1920-2'-O)/16S rRNA (cytidine1409-2'-O)-methyltransferase